jgi:predicted enzyme related to lactoylglutathione lyase
LAYKIVHVEIPSKDVGKNSKFYADAFGWKITAFEELDYSMFEAGDGPGGGFIAGDSSMYKPEQLVVYLESTDIDADLKKIESLGGKTVMAKTEIPGFGWYALFTDPEGNRLALYTGSNPEQ